MAREDILQAVKEKLADLLARSDSNGYVRPAADPVDQETDQ